MNVATMPDKFTDSEGYRTYVKLNQLFAQIIAAHSEGATQVEIACSAWMDALAGSWERRAPYCNHETTPEAVYLTCAVKLRRFAGDLRACGESERGKRMAKERWEKFYASEIGCEELIDAIVGDLVRETNIFPNQVARAKELIRERLNEKVS